MNNGSANRQMNSENPSINLLHFNKRLIDSLNNIFKMSLTIVSAPIGYGKTTAVREYLYRTNTAVLWTTVYSDRPDDFWNMICKALSPYGSEIASKLKDIGLPCDKDMRIEAIKLFGEIDFERETVLVVEDFHTINLHEVTTFLYSLAKKSFRNFHIVITARTSLINDDELLLGGYVNSIPSTVLSLDESEIERFFRRYEIKPGKEDVKSLMIYTEGWISALNTIALTALHSGNHDFTDLSSYDSELIPSIRKLVFEPLPSEYKQFLYSMCLENDFSLEQAEYVWQEHPGTKSAGQLLNYLIDNNIFTLYDKSGNSYHMHYLFLKVIGFHFQRLDKCEKSKYLVTMGNWYAAAQNSNTAVRYYYQAGDYAGICNILASGTADIYKETDLLILIEAYKKWQFRMVNYSFNSVLLLAVMMYLNNYTQIYESILTDLGNNLKSAEHDSREYNLLSVQYEIILSISKNYDLHEIKIHLNNACTACPKGKRAAPVLDWLFGSPSALYLYYKKKEKLNTLADRYIKAMHYYRLLTGYDPGGTEYLIKAEIEFNRCKLDNAEIYLYCGLRNSMKNNEHSLWVACCCLQARISFAKGSAVKAFDILTEAREYINRYSLVKLNYTLDICQSWLYLLSNRPENVSPWLYDKSLIKRKVFHPIVPLGYMIHGMILLTNASYTEFISYSVEENKPDIMKSNIDTEIYEKVFLSIAFKNINLMKEAISYLGEAINYAKDEDIYMPFVELMPWLSDIFNSVKEDRLLTFIDTVKGNVKSQNRNLNLSQVPLTKREKEIVELVQNGLINRQIAEKLFISENTVKSALKQVFKKLGITSRKDIIIKTTLKNHPVKLPESGKG